jgi:hypothetical protein
MMECTILSNVLYSGSLLIDGCRAKGVFDPAHLKALKVCSLSTDREGVTQPGCGGAEWLNYI